MKKRSVTVLGCQWGDEGKGKLVDFLCKRAHGVVRFQGGNNAGHTIFISDKKYVLNLVPSSILHDDAIAIIGNGMVVDPAALCSEIKKLDSVGISCEDRLFISPQAHIILPYHRILDAVREERRTGGKLGTTGKGIGPAYEDKVSRSGIRFGMIKNTVEFRDVFLRFCEEKCRVIQLVYGFNAQLPTPEQAFEDFMGYYKFLQPHIKDTDIIVNDIQNMILEGAQGTFLDIDHGTYPFVTSSNTTAAAAAAGSGLSPKNIGHVLGIFKAYTTRVGSGPFPTELSDREGQDLQSIGGEFGATTGRPRRCGWFDACMARKAHEINGLDSIAITKVDILDTFEKIKICTAYRTSSGERIDTFPVGADNEWGHLTPIYETHPGWKASTAGIQSWDKLPELCKSYLERIAELVEVPISIVSTGQERNDIIERSDVFG